MALKAPVSRPISSREVTGTTVSSRPCCTAFVPSSRRRTGRDRPREKPAATRSPSSPARPVMTMTALTTFPCRACAASAAADTVRYSSCRVGVEATIVVLSLLVEVGQEPAQARGIGGPREGLHERALTLGETDPLVLDHLEQRVDA
jgi:hypothetical protein